MPIYRYRCEACGAREEHLQKISDDPIEVCSSCGGHLVKAMTSAAFHLKGGGWYKDLYASSKSDSGGSSGGGSKDSGSSGSSGDSGGGDSGGGGSDSGGSSSSGSSSSSSSTSAT